MSALHDGGNRLVDLERFGDCDASLCAEFVTNQTEKGGGNKIGMIGMLLPTRGNKKIKLQSGGNEGK